MLLQIIKSEVYAIIDVSVWAMPCGVHTHNTHAHTTCTHTQHIHMYMHIVTRLWFSSLRDVLRSHHIYVHNTMPWDHHVHCYTIVEMRLCVRIYSVLVWRCDRVAHFQNYAVLDWQNQQPIKAPDNEWFTVQYSEVCFGGTNWSPYILYLDVCILE